jgi:hypothetical protein
MTSLLALAISLPCLYWTQGIESRAMLEAAGIKRICVPPDRADAWRAAGFSATAVADADVASREPLPPPGITARPAVASPTRSPWMVTNGWRVMRRPTAKYAYSVAAGKGAIAAAEAFAYGADALLTIDPADLDAVGATLAFLEKVPPVDLPALADFAVVDDGTPLTRELMNQLVRRNLLFDVVRAPSTRYRINVVIGTTEYPREDAADPGSFALKIRRQLTDEQRTLRIYGSEVVVGRLVGDAGRIRLHLINYGGREIEGLRIRLRGAYRQGEALVAGAGRVAPTDHVVAGGVTELSLPRLGTYAVIDLQTAR